jgi:hypothetical protein
MRISTDLQGDLLGKARADMPVPMAEPQPPTGMSQLFTAQVDYEALELASHAAQQQAFAVMAQYEAGTADNTGTLGDFGEPPALVVDTTPITGVRVGRTRAPGTVEQPARQPVVPRAAEPVEPVTGGGAVKPAAEPLTGAEPEPVVDTAPTVDTSPTGDGAPVEPAGSTAASDAPASVSTAPNAAPTAGSVAEPAGGAVGGATPSTRPTPVGPVESTTPNRVSTPQPPATEAPVSTAPANEPAGGPMVSGRQARQEHDDTHDAKYLLDAEDIYGEQQAFSAPVIGADTGSRTRR